jgi:hypothetical protein
MVSDELKGITETLNTQGKMQFLTPCSEEKITQFEHEHSITLPKQYKEWLQFSDGGECFLPAGVQFYGISQKPFIDVDDNSRPDNSYVVIGALASGDPILIKKDSEQISIYNQEAGRIEDDEVYDDFFAFLNDLYDLLGMGE